MTQAQLIRSLQANFSSTSFLFSFARRPTDNDGPKEKLGWNAIFLYIEYFSEYLNTLKAYYIHLLKDGDTINHETFILTVSD